MMDKQQEATETSESTLSEGDVHAAEATGGPGSDEYQELNNRYLRLAADFENFRKRQAQEREHLFKYGAQATLENLLPVLDNLERAQQSLSETSDPKMLYKSFEMLSQQLLDNLKDMGLTKMSPKGEPFDPERHEAISQVENGDVPDQSIIEVYQDGYILHDRVIRPARVVVAVAPAGATPAEAAETESSAGGFSPDAAKNNPFQQTTGH